METENPVLPDPMIYDSLAELENYLDSIRIRREQRRKVRLEVERLQISLQKVSAELEAAVRDDDPEITAELQYVLQEFACRLERIQPSTSQGAISIPPPPIIEPPVPQGHQHREADPSGNAERIYAVCTVGELPSEQREPEAKAPFLAHANRSFSGATPCSQTAADTAHIRPIQSLHDPRRGKTSGPGYTDAPKSSLMRRRHNHSPIAV